MRIEFVKGANLAFSMINGISSSFSSTSSLLADACKNILKRLLIGAQKLVQSRGFYQKSGNEM